jgi:phage terminase small subunit
MTKKDQKKKLTEKQKKFCKEYVLSLNATKAAEKAGYSKDTAYSIGSENLKKPEIKEYIAQLRKDEEDQFYYSRSMSFKKLELVQMLALDRKVVRYTKEGDREEQPAPDIQAYMKAEELKGKLSGLYEAETKQEISINCMGNIKIGGKTLNLKVGKEPTTEEE